MIKNYVKRMNNMTEGDNCLRGGNLAFLFELIDENVLYEELNEKFTEVAEEVREKTILN